MSMTFTRRHALAACAGAVLLPRAAHAQALEQLRVYYGFPPGSAGDITARRVTERLQAAAQRTRLPDASLASTSGP